MISQKMSIATFIFKLSSSRRLGDESELDDACWRCNRPGGEFDRRIRAVLNLTGQFQCVRLCLAAPPAFAYLTQADWELNLVNEAGVPSRAWIDYPGHIWVAAWNEGAFYSPDGMTIQFDNGSVWQRVVEVPVLAPAIRRHYQPYRPIASNG